MCRTSLLICPQAFRVIYVYFTTFSHNRKGRDQEKYRKKGICCKNGQVFTIPPSNRSRGNSERKILLVIFGEIHRFPAGRNPLQGVVVEAAAGAVSLQKSLFDADDLPALQADAVGAVLA
jgi:hypothetical protein